MVQGAECKVHEIADCIFQAMKNQELESTGLGLLSGKMGIIYFSSLYLKLFPNPQQREILDKFTDSFLDQLTNGMESYAFCNGLSGILEGLKNMNKIGIMNLDYSDLDNNYAPLLKGFALYSISNYNYDFLHGALGIIKYFNEDTEFINEVLSLLEQTAEKKDNTYRWNSQIGAERKIGCNIALSHGISSIIVVLSKLDSVSINHESRDRIIEKACNYINSQEIDFQKYGCYFPSISLNEQDEIKRSRLAWCYGDLGVAAALWEAGKVLNNQTWKSKAIEIFTFSSKRRSQEDAMIQDVELCHGSASLVMMFDYMYRETGNDLFRETRDFWMKKSLELSCFKDGLAGYKTWQGPDKWRKEYDILNGISGIGLMFLSVLYNEYKWMEFFMLH